MFRLTLLGPAACALKRFIAGRTLFGWLWVLLLSLPLVACAPAPLPAGAGGAAADGRQARQAASLPTAASAPAIPVPIDASRVAISTPSGVPAAPAGTDGASTAAAATASAGGPTGFALGVPAGDAYAPMSLAVDAARGRAYVYHGDSTEGRPVVSVVDLAAGQVSRVIPLGAARPAGYGRILLSPDGAQAYVFDFDAGTLTAVDLAAGTPGRPIPGLRDGVLSPDGKTLYALGPWGLRAYDLAELSGGEPRPLWEANSFRFDRLALGGDRLLASVQAPQPQLLVFDAATGVQVAQVTLNGYPNGIAPGPDGGWAARVSGDLPQVQRFGPDLKLLASAEAPYGTEIYYDADRGRYLVSGPMPGEQGAPALRALRADDLSPVAVVPWPSGDAPDVFAPHGDALLGLRRSGPARLSLLGPDLDVTGRVVTGVALRDMALDEASDTLYVADDQGQVHVIGLPGGAERALWHGSAPIALDVPGRRLYVNGSGGVQALDLGTGEVVAAYPQAGMLAPDSRSEMVYIAGRGVTVYDRRGGKLGEAPGTFPRETGLSPNPYAYAVRVNPVNGALAITFDNGVPGSNNSSYLRLHLPGAEGSTAAPGFFSFVNDVVFSAVNGDLYASYGPAKGQEGVQRLGPDGEELARLRGRSGALALDAGAGLLYVAQGGAIARLAADTLDLVDLWQGPARVDRIALHAGLGQLYVLNTARSLLSVIPVDALQPFDMRPQPAGALPAEATLDGLAVVDDGKGGQWLFVDAAGALYRSHDGARWERLPVGSLPVSGRVTAAGDGTLFYAGQGAAGSDGVWRSSDFGESWALLSAGLTDLRTDQPVRAGGVDRAYFVGRASGLFAWQPGAGGAPGRWVGRLAPAEEWEGVGQLALAPDATLFLAGFERLRRSTDDGRSWTDLQPPARAGSLLGFSASYTETRTLFGLYGETERRLFRSTDAGDTWARVAAPLDLDPLASALTLKSIGETVYLFGQGYDGAPSVLLRSTDNGDHWQVADEPEIAETQKMAVGPDGRFWLGRPGMVGALDPDAIHWASPDQP